MTSRFRLPLRHGPARTSDCGPASRESDGRRGRRTLLVVAAGTLAVVSGSGTAFAYWSSSGSGSHVVPAADPAPVTVTVTVTGALQPGARLPVTLTITNPDEHPAAVTDVAPGPVTVTGDSTCTATNSAVTFAALSGDWRVPAASAAGPGTLVVGPLPDGVSMGSEAHTACQGATFSTTMTATGTVG